MNRIERLIPAPQLKGLWAGTLIDFDRIESEQHLLQRFRLILYGRIFEWSQYWCLKQVRLHQRSTLTFQLTRQVASDILDVTTISVWLLAKLARGNRKPLAKTEFLQSVASGLP